MLQVSNGYPIFASIIKKNTMKNTQITNAEQRLQELKHACINSHPSMKAYYQEQYYQWNQHLSKLRGV